MERTRARTAWPNRDVALLYVLLTTGAKPLEIARLEVRDYLNADGSVREHSMMREEVAVNGKARPLFFASAKARDAIDSYLADRSRRAFCTTSRADFRGLEPHSQLFLTEAGAPFEIVAKREKGQMHFICTGIHNAYWSIFRRIGLPGVSAQSLRRMVAIRLFQRGATEEQIGEVLGISEKEAVRRLLSQPVQPLHSIVRELV